MANTTHRGALHIHGTNPQFLVEKVIRARIYDSLYWKEHCFALTAETLIDRALELHYVGGTYGVQKVSPFLCLVLKLLQLQPEREIILEYLAAEEFKYLRALAAMYVRLTFRAVDVYETLEPLLNDSRKLRWRDMSGAYRLSHMDEFVDELLTQERACDLILPRLTRRDVVEETEGLAPRISKLEDALLHGKIDAAKSNEEEGSGAESDDSAKHELAERKQRVERARRLREERMAEDDKAASMAMGNADDYPSQEEDEDADEERFVSRSPSRSASPANGYVSRSPSRSPDREGNGYVSRSPSRSPDRQGNGYVSRSPSRSPDRS